jgi:hypothetical protein
MDKIRTWSSISIWTVFLALVALGVYTIVLRGSGHATSNPVSQTLNADWKVVKSMSDLLHQRDYAGAENLYESIVSSPTASKTTKIRATLDAAHLKFAQTGNAQDVIDSVKVLKKVVADPAGILIYQARAITLIAEWYHLSGYNKAVFRDIFSDPEYAKYEVPGEPQASIRNVYLWSYKMQPTYRAAIGIAHTYADEVLGDKTLSTTTREQYLDGAELYLSRAETLAAVDLKSATEPRSSGPYTGYLVRRAFVISALAYARGGEYKDKWEPAYQEIFSTIKTYGNPFTEQYLPTAHIEHAAFIQLIDKNTDAAKKEATVAMQLLKDDSRPDLNRTLQTIRGLKDNADSDTDRLHVMLLVESISPEFKKFVEDEQR